MKKLLCLLLCAAVLCFNTVTIFAIEESLDGDTATGLPASPTEPGTPTPLPISPDGAKPVITPTGLVVSGDGSTTVDLSAMKSVVFSGNTATFTYSDPTIPAVKHTLDPLKENSTYSIPGAQGATNITINSFKAPLIFGTQLQPQSYTLSGNLAAQAMTIYGNISALDTDATLYAPFSCSGTVTAVKNISLRQPNPAPVLVPLAVAATQIASTNGNVIVEASAAVTGDVLAQNGTITVDGSITAPGYVQAKSLVVNGTVQAANIQTINGDLTGSGTINGKLNINGNIYITGPLSTVGGTVTKLMRASGSINLTGPLNAGDRIYSDNGDIITSVNAPISHAGSIEAPNGSINLGATADVSNGISGKKGVIMNGGSSSSICSDNAVTLNGNIRTGQINAGNLTIDGNTNAKAVYSSMGLVTSNGVVTCDSFRADNSLTVRGRVNASGSVRGNPVSTPSGGVIQAGTITGMDNGNKGKLTIRTPFGSNRNIYVELRLSGGNANGYDIKTDSDGKVSFDALVPGNYSVYAESGSSSRRDTVKVSDSGTTTLDLRSNAGTGSGGGTTGGGNHFDEDAFWEDVSDEIRTAKRGDTVRVSASKADSVPTWILKELEGRAVTLKLTHGRDNITIYGKNMYDIPNNRVFYTFSDLADLYKYQPDDNSSSSSKPSSSSSKPTTIAPTPPTTPPAASNPPTNQITPTTPAPPPTASTPHVTPPVPTPIIPPATVSSSSSSSSSESSSEEESSSSEEESSMEEPEEPETEPVDKKQPNMFPIIISVALALLSLGGIAVGYVIYRRNRDNTIYDDDDEE